LPLPVLRRDTRGSARGRRSPSTFALADVSARGRSARHRLDRGDHAIHPGRLQQRPAARRSFPLRPLALCRHADGRPLQISRAHDRGTADRPGTSDRARPLRAARRLCAGRPPFGGAIAAPARPLLAHAVAQPDRHGLTVPQDTWPQDTWPQDTWPQKILGPKRYLARQYLPKSNNYLTM